MTTPSTLTARTPEDVFAAVPSILGFHPTDSVVMLTFGGFRTFHARVDLPDDPGEVDCLVEQLLAPVRAHRVPRVLLLAYTTDAALGDHALGELEDAFEDEGVVVMDLLRTDGRSWFPVRAGLPYHLYDGVPYDVTTHPFAAQAVLDGRVTHASRDDLAATLVGTDPAAIEDVGAAALGAAELVGEWQRAAEAQWVRATVVACVSDRRVLTVAEAGRLLVALLDVGFRDVAWASVTHENAVGHIDLWRDLVRRCPTELLAAPAALLGFSAWLAGQGALAWCALDRTALADPDYSMAGLVAQALEHALSPENWESIPEDMLLALRGE